MGPSDRRCDCRQNRARTFAEADAIAVSLCVAAQDERVSVLQESTRRSIPEGQRLGAVPGKFEQTAALMLLRAADRTGAEDVADPHGTAAKGMVDELLGARPVHVFEAGARDDRLSVSCAEGDLKRDIVVLRVLAGEVGQRHRLLSGTLDQE